MPAIKLKVVTFFMGISSIKVDIGVARVEGIHVANNGLNLNTVPKRIDVCGAVKEIGPLIKLPASLVVVIELGPAAIWLASSSIFKKEDDALSFFNNILFTCKEFCWLVA